MNRLLSPVLLLQALWVKLKTLRLPEYKTPEFGHTSKEPRLSVLLLGDSSAAGVGATCFKQSLMGQLIEQLPFGISYRIVAFSGDKSTTSLGRLKAIEGQYFDVIITVLGVNDVIAGTHIDDWLSTQQQLHTQLKRNHNASQLIVCGVPPMSTFPALPTKLSHYLGNKASQLDLALQQQLTSSDAQYFSLRDFPAELPAASDGFHPGPDVYHHWANKLAVCITRHFDWH